MEKYCSRARDEIAVCVWIEPIGTADPVVSNQAQPIGACISVDLVRSKHQRISAAQVSKTEFRVAISAGGLVRAVFGRAILTRLDKLSFSNLLQRVRS
jgi:hypothetical protein